jgi:glycosyltransferase involved in cell wall biosynthesis
MKVCLVGLEIIPQINLSFYGGLANNVINIAKGLKSKNKYEFKIVSSDSRRVLSGPLATPWADIYPIETRAQFTSSLFGFEFLLKTLKSLLTDRSLSDCDIVHVHSAYPVLGLTSQLASLLPRAKSVFTLYSPLSSFAAGRGHFLRKIPQRSLSKMFLSRIHKIVVVSKNVERSLRSAGFGQDRISVIPTAVDTQLFNSRISGKQTRLELSLDDDPVILYCGNWTPWKGVDLLVDSMKKVTQEFPSAKLLLAFGEPIEWHLENKLLIQKKIRDLEIESNIIEIGFVDEIWRLMAACDVFVAPFRDTREVADIPLAILEAMACGKAVVATRVGGIPEIIRHCENGLLVNPNDSIGLGEALCSLLKNQQMSEELGNNASKYAIQNHSLEIVAEKMEFVYEHK